MVASFEAGLAERMNKKTDTHLMASPPRTPSSPGRTSPFPEQPPQSIHLSEQFTWYRMDWGTGGNKFPKHLTPRDTGKPWGNQTREGVSAFVSPPDVFADLGAQPELEQQKHIINRSIAPCSWTPRDTADDWAAALLARGTTVRLRDMKSSRPVTAFEKADARWEPGKHQRKSFKPTPVEELSPYAPHRRTPASQRGKPRFADELLSPPVDAVSAQDPRAAASPNR